MNVFLRNTLSFFLTILSAPVWALSVNDPTESTGRAGVTDRISSVVYKFVEVNNVLVTSLPVEPTANLTGASSAAMKSRIVRVDQRVISGNSSSNFIDNDMAIFSVNTPSRGVNNALSFVSTVSDTPLSNATTKWLQVLSMLASRKADFQMAYAARLSSTSRIESNIDCRLVDNGVSKLTVLARIQYRLDF